MQMVHNSTYNDAKKNSDSCLKFLVLELPQKKRDVVKEWPDFEEKDSYRVLENLKNSTNFGKIALH